MSRVRIEGLLAAFPKLVGTGAQHTFVETENVRYVYVPLEQMYMLVITNKSSNILEDLETLHLLSKLIPEYCHGTTEADVTVHAFDLVNAMDEVLTLGYRDRVTLPTIKTQLLMESHEEKVHDMVQENRRRDADAARARKIADMDKARKDAAKSGGGMPGMGSGGIASQAFGSSSMGGGGGGMSSAPPTSAAVVTAGPASGASAAKPASGGGGDASQLKGMRLGAKVGKTNALLEQMRAEGVYSAAEVAAAPVVGSAAGAAHVGSLAAPMEAVHVSLVETVTVVWGRDGGLQSFEVKGAMSLNITTEAAGRVALTIDLGAAEAGGFKFQVHPHLDKAAFTASGRLGLKDTNKAFPCNSPLQVLRWRKVSTSEADVPLQVTCWPSGKDVTVDYALNTPGVVLHDVQISIPIPGAVAPTVRRVDGSTTFAADACLKWSVPLVDSSNAQGNLEFEVAAPLADSLYFPVGISFAAENPFCPLVIRAVQDAATGAAVAHSSTKSVLAENYQVVDQ